MIAENVKISIFGNISDNLYSARVSTDGSASTKSAYFVTRKGADEYFDGIVVAVAEFEGLTGERMIVARYGDIYYEPELRRILSKLKNIKLKSIRCLYEKSCGAIIFYKTKQNTKILLVKNNNGRYWSFPKGRVLPVRQNPQEGGVLPRQSVHRQRCYSGGGNRQLHLG